jgi:hypothetical protein
MSSIQRFIEESLVGEILDSLDAIKKVLSKAPQNVADEPIELQFPTVVVIGQENAGKSSVLERLCRFSFFPRSNDVTTRMPIELRLIRCTPERLALVVPEEGDLVGSGAPVNARTHALRISFQSEGFKSAIFLSLSDAFGDLSKDVLKFQETVLKKLTGKQTSFLKDPLKIEIWSTDIPDITLIDLPGVFSVAGPDDPKNIVDYTKQITLDHLKLDSAVFCVVVSGKSDSARNDVVLGMLDASGRNKNAVCALTRADRCLDEDSKAALRGYLKGANLPCLGGGYVALKNRNTATKDTVSLIQADKEEDEFFKKEFPELVDGDQSSIGCLIKRIGDLLVDMTMNSWVEKAVGIVDLKLATLTVRAQSLGFDPANASEEQKLKLLESCLGLCASHAVLNLPLSIEKAFVKLESVHDAMIRVGLIQKHNDSDEGALPSAPDLHLVSPNRKIVQARRGAGSGVVASDFGAPSFGGGFGGAAPVFGGSSAAFGGGPVAGFGGLAVPSGGPSAGDFSFVAPAAVFGGTSFAFGGAAAPPGAGPSPADSGFGGFSFGSSVEQGSGSTAEPDFNFNFNFHVPPHNSNNSQESPNDLWKWDGEKLVCTAIQRAGKDKQLRCALASGFSQLLETLTKGLEDRFMVALASDTAQPLVISRFSLLHEELKKSLIAFIGQLKLDAQRRWDREFTFLSLCGLTDSESVGMKDFATRASKLAQAIVLEDVFFALTEVKAKEFCGDLLRRNVFIENVEFAKTREAINQQISLYVHAKSKIQALSKRN